MRETDNTTIDYIDTRNDDYLFRAGILVEPWWCYGFQ